MRYLLLITFIFTNLVYAISIDIVELYRTKGISAVENEIEKQLKSKHYWDFNLKGADISNGYYESIRYVMLCQKDLKDIVLYDTKKDEKLFSSSVLLGEKNGDKKIEGDLKTPIGAYDLTKRITSLDPFYGPLALTTNYPNIYDKSQGKTGHGIWIHGLPLDQSREEYTKGCIALDNTEIKKLDSSINIDNSVLVISQNKLKPVPKDDISLIMSNIFKWKDSWKKSDIDTYLSFYDKNFKKSNGDSLKKFSRYKKTIFKRKEKKTIIFNNINIIPYPNDENKKIYKVVLDEIYKTKNYKFEGKKELYVEILNNNFTILTES
ncbi:MAG: L,D-transpeptidase family protein [Campylobacterota bacterium]|nr:L,D-transpeptidase family protein [Campylobacterota bacterium]